MGEKPIVNLYQLLAELKVKPKPSAKWCSKPTALHRRSNRTIESLAATAAEIFDVELERGLYLLTIRHYTPDYSKNTTEGKEVVLEQKSNETVQVLMKA